MTMPETRSGRPNTSGTRGGQAQSSPLPLAEEQYSKDNEQKFRRQLMDMLSPVQQQVAGLASGLTGLLASLVANDSGVTGSSVKDALDWLLANKQALDSDLTAIAALTPANDDFIQRKASAWTNRTMAQLLVDLAAPGTTFQPLDADLTAIAALATTSYGRALLALSAATSADWLVKAQNLADLGSASTSRTNLDVEQLGVSGTPNRQTASYVYVLGDRGKTVEMNVAGANTLTIPPHSSVAFAVGTYLNFAQYGAGQTTITPGSGVTLRGANGLKTSAQYSIGTAYQTASDEWIVGGDMTT